ncbi:MAG: histidine kinase [Bacteroidetes bacterium]|nr:histidine kinase [Bacteroidota bacterium]
MNSGSKSHSTCTPELLCEPKWWQQTAITFDDPGRNSLITVVSQLFLRRYRKKLTEERIEKQLSELELKAIKAQINPHFIFNTLNAIQYFISNQENDRAVNYLNQMSKLIRSTLDYSNEVSIALREEISYLKTYLDLESLRFEEDEFYYLIDNTLSSEEMELMIPTMVLQPHIENAVRHGLKPKKGNNKQLILRFYRHQSEIFCEIEDNGIGREASARLKRKALFLICHRVKLSASKLEIYHKQREKHVRTVAIKPRPWFI